MYFGHRVETQKAWQMPSWKESKSKRQRAWEAVFVSDMNIDELKGEGVFALGCPAMGAEVLEESEMEPFVADVEGFASGKKIGLFGSYGWGDGQWMRDWEARMSGAGATIVGGEGVICQEAPDADAIEQCKALGKALANA